jgi:hypothetical protein
MQNLKKVLTASAIIFVLAVLFAAQYSRAQGEQDFAGALLQRSTLGYEIGAVTTRDLWVDPKSGSDSRSGTTRALALKTLDAAWRKIPVNQDLRIGFRINLVRGEYSRNALPNYLENRRGSKTCPIILRSADGKGAAVLRGDLNIFNCAYFYLLDLTIAPRPAGDTLHFEKCRFILLRGLKLDGGVFTREGQSTPVAHDNLKVNQSQNIFVEECDISGADDNALDFVAVQNGHIARSKIHNANDWCAYVKGGSANFAIEGNEIWGGGTGGFTAGQGTGFQWMVAPFLKYEAENIVVRDNFIHDCSGAGLGVNGGYKITMENNTLLRVGSRDHAVEFVFGARSCDGSASDDRSGCTANLKKGGWGTTRIDDGENFVRIPNKEITFRNNVILNNDQARTSQIFTVFGPYNGSAQNNSNAPRPARADEKLRIYRNMIWNAGETPLGIEGENDGCQNENPDCNAAQLQRENSINARPFTLMNPTRGDYRVLFKIP